jgi:hypothetical protein
VLALAAATLIAAAGAVTSHVAGTTGARPDLAGPIAAQSATQPTPTSVCAATRGIRCYAPAQFEKAYDLAGLHGAGIDGSGETIAIVDSFGSPTVANDLHQFDQTFGQANPYGIAPDPEILQDPKLTIITPAGPPPAYDPTSSDMAGWAEETSLDVQWAHVMAPKANILLVETPTSETEGVQGFPEIVTAENYVIDNHLAGVITQSFGATEETFPNQQSLLNLRSAFVNAQKNDVTVLGSSGDEGSTDWELNGEDLYPMQVNSWPSSDPLVTSVGGTKMNLDDAGNRLSPDVVWNDTDVGRQAAGGGGLSAVFSRPDFQNGVKSVVGGARGTPDISLNAAVNGGVWVYLGFAGPGLNPASPWHIFGGTSAASPEFSGVVAMAEQVAGQQLGDINGALYKIPYGGGLVDVTSGNNDIGPFVNSDGNTYHVPGFDAGPGYDLASGLGTIDAGRFVPSLAALASCAGGPAGPGQNGQGQNGQGQDGPGNGGPGCGPGPHGHNVDCSSAMSFAAVTGDLHVRRGATCSLTSSAVDGNVMVDNGATLTLNGVTVAGDVHAGGGTTITGSTVIEGNAELANGGTGAPNVVCGSTIQGNLDVHNNRSTTWIGTSPSCTAGNTIGHDLNVHDNNVSGGPSASVSDNTVGHNLDCHGNNPPPTGSGNTAARKSGQCATF